MSLAAIPNASPIPAPLGITLLELITRETRETDTPEAAIERVYALLRSGRVYLVGAFRGPHIIRPN